jgi:Amt family ammonium transporter
MMQAGAIDSGHTAWMLISMALVQLMLPGLAFFYAGLLRHK